MIQAVPLSLSSLEDHMVFVEGGKFKMGGEIGYEDAKPIHEVRLKSFHLCRYPVTQLLWQQVMDKNPAEFSHPSRPVERVSWDDCQLFLEKLNQESPHTYRLPTEAEWEYAARGGKYKRELEYAGSNNLHEVAWHNVGNGNIGNALDISQPVAFKRPNSLGLYDMSGNVDEWCQDLYSTKYYQKYLDEGTVDNPFGPTQGENRVVRGGSWSSDYVGYFRPDVRDTFHPDFRNYDIGFRLSRY